jgi:hypothetical protein
MTLCDGCGFRRGRARIPEERRRFRQHKDPRRCRRSTARSRDCAPLLHRPDRPCDPRSAPAPPSGRRWSSPPRPGKKSARKSTSLVSRSNSSPSTDPKMRRLLTPWASHAHPIAWTSTGTAVIMSESSQASVPIYLIARVSASRNDSTSNEPPTGLVRSRLGHEVERLSPPQVVRSESLQPQSIQSSRARPASVRRAGESSSCPKRTEGNGHNPRNRAAKADSEKAPDPTVSRGSGASRHLAVSGAPPGT